MVWGSWGFGNFHHNNWHLNKLLLKLVQVQIGNTEIIKENVWSAHRQTQVKVLFLEGRKFQILCQNGWKYNSGICLCISMCDIIFLHECIVNLLFYQSVSFVQNGITGFVMYNINLCKCPYKIDLIQNLRREITNRYLEK